MPRAGLSRQAVVEAAIAVADEAGPSGFGELTLASVAASVGVAVPSLYKHVSSLADLRAAISAASADRLHGELTAATVGRAGPDALIALAAAVRSFAIRYPARYIAVQLAPSVAQGGSDDEVARSGSAVVDVIARALRGFSLPEDREVDAIRLVRSAIHGFVMLELGGGFGLPDDVDRSFAVVVGTLVAGIERLAAESGGTAPRSITPRRGA